MRTEEDVLGVVIFENNEVGSRQARSARHLELSRRHLAWLSDRRARLSEQLDDGDTGVASDDRRRLTRAVPGAD